MTQPFSRVLLAVVLLLAAFSFSAVAAQNQVIIAEGNDITTFDPHMATDKPTISVNEHIFEGLIRLNMSGEFEPQLATGWVIDETETVWTFYLRRGVTFTDGTPFDAHAVKVNIDRIMDPATGAAGRARLAGLDRIEVVDDFTIKFITETPWPALLDGLAGNSTRIISPLALETYGDGVDRNPVGTGPFKLAEWQVGRQVVLDRNENYWGERPTVDRIIFRPVPEDSVRAALLEAGEIDIAMKIPPEITESFKNHPRVDLLTPPSSYSVFYMLNMKRSPLDDVRVREAINIALDREAIIEGILQGFGTQPRSIFTDSVPYRKELDPIPYDPDRARRLLAEAGYAQGLHLTLWTSPRYLNDKQLAEAIQAYLAQVGITVDVSLYDWGTYWAMINEPDKDVDMYLLATTILDPAYRLEWNFGRYAGGYWNGYGSEEFWTELEQASMTIDEDTRRELFGRLQERVWRDFPYLFLYDRTLIFGVRKGLTGLAIDGREIWDLTRVQLPR